MMRVRFAPSPTGQLHVGNARTALFNWLLSHGHEGTFILRIEDTDAERSTRESEASILEDVRWLGLEWDEGPDVGGRMAPIASRSGCTCMRRTPTSCSHAGHAYYCFCSPREARGGAPGRRSPPAARRGTHGTCRTLVDRGGAGAASTPANGRSIRFRVPDAPRSSFQDLVRGEVTFNTDVIGDPVLVRSDGRPAYNFAVVVDDALMEMTHVIRGEDHISNTPRQVLLYRGARIHAAEVRASGAGAWGRITRRCRSATARRRSRSSAQRGYLPEALTNYLALIGWSPRRAASGHDEELLPLDELARRFALENVGHSAGVFDVEKLAWMNRHYMKAAAPARIAAESARYFQARGFVAATIGTRARPTSSRCCRWPWDRWIGWRRFPTAWRSSSPTMPRAALVRPDVAEVVHEPGAREVIAALAEAMRGRRSSTVTRSARWRTG